MTTKDCAIVKAFVEHLRVYGYPGLKVDRIPDDENRNTCDIDAVAGEFAIEHTSIDTLPDQRCDDDWFMRVVGPIEEELKGEISFRFNITLKYDAVKKGQNWGKIRQSLNAFICNQAADLSDGRHVLENVPGLPFSLNITKASDRSPGVFFARYPPEDATLAERVRELFDRKAKKLAKYETPETTTVLLVENNDIALMNDAIMLEAIQSAYPTSLPRGVNQVWYADTSVPPDFRFENFTPRLINR